MNHFQFVIFFTLAGIAGCKTRNFNPDDSSTSAFNSQHVNSDDWKAVVKLNYMRRGIGFSSSAVFISPNVLLTSGHSLADGAEQFEALISDSEKIVLPKVDSNRKIFTFKKMSKSYLPPNMKEVQLDWDVGALVFDKPVTQNFVSPSVWPIGGSENLRMVSVGSNVVDNSPTSVVKMLGDYSTQYVGDISIAYTMNVPGSPYSALGDSGAPLLLGNSILGVHGGNFALGTTVQFGYASALHYAGAKEFWKKVWLQGGVGIERPYAVSTYASCLQHEKPDFRKWAPLSFSISKNGAIKGVLFDTTGWTNIAPFGEWNLPGKPLLNHKPWLATDNVNKTLTFALYDMEGGCVVKLKKTEVLETPTDFASLEIDYLESPEGIAVAVKSAQNNVTRIKLY